MPTKCTLHVRSTSNAVGKSSHSTPAVSVLVFPRFLGRPPAFLNWTSIVSPSLRTQGRVWHVLVWQMARRLPQTPPDRRRRDGRTRPSSRSHVALERALPKRKWLAVSVARWRRHIPPRHPVERPFDPGGRRFERRFSTSHPVSLSPNLSLFLSLSLSRYVSADIPTAVRRRAAGWNISQTPLLWLT